MRVPIYFVPATGNDPPTTIAEKIETLYSKAGFNQCFTPDELVAIKMHFGEKGNTTHVSPKFVRPLVKMIERNRGKPFLTDTNVLYRSERSDAVSHLKLAHSHGFTLENVGAPVIITDGLIGSNEIEVDISGQLFSKVSIAPEALMANALFVITHFTGHIAMGFGGTLKNLGMGLSSRKGKLRQHSSMTPRIAESRCTGCEQCVRWCPQNTISMRGQVAVIDPSGCIGCGECLVVCRFNAVSFDWRVTSADLQKKVAEHAYGVIINKKGKLAFLNFLISMTKDCDCLSQVQEPLASDIGILAGKDAVAIDRASLDLFKEYTGRHLSELAYRNINYNIQLDHAQAIGMGSQEYELIKL